MAIIRWEPFRMEDFPELKIPRFGTDLAVDVYERDGNVIAEMQLPGVKPEDIEVDIEEDFVKVSANREEEKEEENKNYYYKEIQKGSFERSFRLPTKVNPEMSDAEFEDGVLTIMMPKVEQKISKKISVSGNKEIKPKAEKTEPKPAAKTSAKKVKKK